jgi:uncharacterized membrane protein
MGIGWLDGLIYVVGLVLIFVPAESLPELIDDAARQRVIKHVIGLLLFAVGTIGIHTAIRHRVGQGFMISSLIGLMIMSLVKVWWETR